MSGKEISEQERLERQVREMQRERTREQYKSRLLMELPRHIGRGRAIGMGELYTVVYGEDWQNRINDTRPLRKLITDLRWGRGSEPLMIASVCCSYAPGYFIPAAGSEAQDYIKKRLVKPALKKLALAARLEKISLARYLGQLALELEGN
jgi:hypothetical protein